MIEGGYIALATSKTVYDRFWIANTGSTKMSIIWELVAQLFGFTVEKSLSSDYRNDPVYKKNVQELIERNRRFEKKE